MKSSNIITLAVLGALTMLVGTAAFAATVTSTVTVQNVSVTVASGTIAWGTLAANTGSSTSPTYTQTLTNAGNVPEDFTITGANATGAVAWTLAATTGSEQYVHEFCTSSCTSAPTGYTPLTLTPQSLGTTVSAAGTKPLDLYIKTPTVTADYASHSVAVTITAAAH